MIKNDLLTGEPFETNRSNQNFINSQNRIKYYNEKARQFRLRNSKINKLLQKNLKILDDLLANKREIEVHKQFLLGKGFSFNVHTHYELYENRNRIAIYEYIVVVLENEQIKIIKK